MDILHKIVKGFDHKRGLVVSVILGALVCLGIAGCPATTGSILNPGTEVTAPELEGEALDIAALGKTYVADMEAKTGKLEIARADIKQQNERKQKLVELAGGVALAAAGGGINPATGIAAIVQAMTLCIAGGALYDKRRTDKVLAKKKAEANGEEKDPAPKPGK